MSIATTILILLTVYFAGRILGHVLAARVRYSKLPRYTFDDLQKIFTSKDVQVTYPPREAPLPATLFVAQVSSQQSQHVASYVADRSEHGKEHVILYDPHHKKLTVDLLFGNVESVDHGGIHTKKDLTQSELDILADLCGRVRDLVKAPMIQRSS